MSAGPAFEFLLDKMKGGWAWWQMVILFRKALVMICAMMFDGNAVLGWCALRTEAVYAAS